MAFRRKFEPWTDYKNLFQNLAKINDSAGFSFKDLLGQVNFFYQGI